MKTKESFLLSELTNISQVYEGKQNCCRCGCQGTYTATTNHINPHSPIDDNYVLMLLEKGKRLVKKGNETICGYNYVDITTGRNKALTFYFDHLK